MNGNPWTQPEIDHLLELAGDQPFPMLCRMHNREAGRQGWPLRTKTAIRTAIYRYGGTSYTVGEWITARQASLMLNGSDVMVQYWIDQGWLPSRSYTESKKAFHYVSRTDLRKLARVKPQLFAGQSEATLNELLCDEHLAEKIAATYTRRHSVACPVIQLETGRRYPSIKAAARAIGVTHQAIQYALKTMCAVGGYHWQFANPRHRDSAYSFKRPQTQQAAA